MARPVLAAGVAAAVALAAGCGGASATDPPSRQPATHPAYGHASAGGLRVTHAYVPEPASPAVAAAYFTVRNTGGSADVLTKVSSPAAASVGLHHYVTSSSGSSSGAKRMVPLRGGLRIPAHGTVALHPGGTHVMLIKPSDRVRKGRHIGLRLTFEHAGTVRVPVPVTASAGMGGMSGMHSGGMSTSP